jgi:hypothetical protein
VLWRHTSCSNIASYKILINLKKISSFERILGDHRLKNNFIFNQLLLYVTPQYRRDELLRRFTGYASVANEQQRQYVSKCLFYKFACNFNYSNNCRILHEHRKYWTKTSADARMTSISLLCLWHVTAAVKKNNNTKKLSKAICY